MEEILDPLTLARWQFGLTTIYHFLFVPLTLGLVLLVAIWQTKWVRTGKLKYLQLTRYFGSIFLINFAMGIVTGIVQEFQFGMNWSDYSRFTGDVFGAPLAFEGLLAFFFEATMVGLWIFGWDKLPQKVHLLSIWGLVIGTWTSAYFILVANAFMQNPVGYAINQETGRAELTDFGAVLTNPVAFAALGHTLAASIMFGCTVVVACAAWHLKREKNTEVMRHALKVGLWGTILGGIGVLVSGDQLSLVMVATQPMKMAAAEATYDTVSGADASFSIFTLGTPDGKTELFSVRIPYVLALLSTHDPNGTVHGINDLQAEYQALFGPGDYTPTIWITYWAFRWMMFFGFFAIFVAIVDLIVTRKGRQPKAWMWNIAMYTSVAPLLGIIVGWIFTEMGRQPWLVFSLLPTEAGVSPNVSGLSVLLSLIGFTLVYGILAVVEVKLVLKAAKKDPPSFEDVAIDGDSTDDAAELKLESSVY